MEKRKEVERESGQDNGGNGAVEREVAGDEEEGREGGRREGGKEVSV